MSSSPTSAPPTPDRAVLPCQRDPERWFDRADRTDALAGCLQCPARRWCAREALAARAQFGMWAGIWIDANLAEAGHYLRAIAEASPPASPPLTRNTTPHRTIVAARDHPAPVRISGAPQTVAAAITARSSGHCEIMAPDCVLTINGIASRIRGRRWQELPDPAAGYAVCRACQAMVARMELRLSRQLGYLVDSPADATTVPFYWRQNRWMRLDSVGGAAPCPLAQRSA